MFCVELLQSIINNFKGCNFQNSFSSFLVSVAPVTNVYFVDFYVMIYHYLLFEVRRWVRCQCFSPEDVLGCDYAWHGHTEPVFQCWSTFFLNVNMLVNFLRCLATFQPSVGHQYLQTAFLEELNSATCWSLQNLKTRQFRKQPANLSPPSCDVNTLKILLQRTTMTMQGMQKEPREDLHIIRMIRSRGFKQNSPLFGNTPNSL